jgi:hypothetical protein
MSTQDPGRGLWFDNQAPVFKDGPYFQYGGEMSLESGVDQAHYLGTEPDGLGEPVDLYIHVSENTGESKLIARFGDGVDDFMEDSLKRIFGSGAEWANVMAGVDRSYGIRMAFDAALEAGYDLAQVAADSPQVAEISD